MFKQFDQFLIGDILSMLPMPICVVLIFPLTLHWVKKSCVYE